MRTVLYLLKKRGVVDELGIGVTHGSGIMTSTRRDASGRVTGSSTGSGKCQGGTRTPVPFVGTKK